MTINMIGLSGGKDSTRLVGWAIHESGYPRESLLFSFCDTENEYDEVYQQIDALDAYIQRHGCKPVLRLRADEEWVAKYWMFPLFLALAIWKGRFPSAKARFCTDQLKIRPTEQLIQKLKDEGHEVVTHSGVRAAESLERSLMQEWDNGQFSCRVRRPLLKLTIEDVWEGHKRYGLPINPLYRLGWKRVGCRLCIMSNKKDVRRTVKQRRWVIDLYRSWELIVGAYSKARGSASDFSSWFRRTNVPAAQRTRLVNTKKGWMTVCTIDDVARWSTTTHGGVHQEMEFMHEEESFNIDDTHAPCKSGYCE